MKKPKCKLCGEEIYAILDVKYVKGVEIPTHLHNVCFDRININSDLFLNELNNAAEWALDE